MMLYFVVENPRMMEKPPRSSGQEQRHGMEVHGLRDQLGSWIVAILPNCYNLSRLKDQVKKLLRSEAADAGYLAGRCWRTM
jgi:hypothetical protein